jgi:hypothetical protein
MAGSIPGVMSGRSPEAMSGVMSGRSPEAVSGSISKEDKIRNRGMESVLQKKPLKTNLIKIKQQDTGTFVGKHAKNNETCLVRGMIVGFEMMGLEAGAGEGLKGISELKFRESLENSYRCLEKRKRVCVPPTAKPKHKESPGRHGTWSSPTLSALKRSRLVTGSKRTEFSLTEATGPIPRFGFGAQEGRYPCREWLL